MLRRLILFCTVGLAAWSSIIAQEGPDYKVSNHVLNAGGHPVDGVVMASPQYRITLDVVVSGTAGVTLTGVGYRMENGFGSVYPPPGEVQGLRFIDKHTLTWRAERSMGAYNVYRGRESDLSGLDYGECLWTALTDEVVSDSDPVPAGEGYFYLATVDNRLDEEGSKGIDSTGTERDGNFCP